ncbi:hypothetical protein AADW59_00840 [Candidatus Hodgkinia cicadicola]
MYSNAEAIMSAIAISAIVVNLTSKPNVNMAAAAVCAISAVAIFGQHATIMCIHISDARFAHAPSVISFSSFAFGFRPSSSWALLSVCATQVICIILSRVHANTSSGTRSTQYAAMYFLGQKWAQQK